MYHIKASRGVRKFIVGLLIPALLITGASLTPAHGEGNGPVTTTYLPVVGNDTQTQFSRSKVSKTISLAPVAPPPSGSKPQKIPQNGVKIPRPTANIQSVALAANQTYPRDMKVLVVCPNDQEPAHKAITSFLAQIGIPYNVLLADQMTLTSNMLSDSTKAFYQGVVLCNGALLATGSSASAFDSYEWQTLWDFEALFGIRQVTFYTAPGFYPESYGMNYAGERSTIPPNAPLTATLTSFGQTLFNDLQPNAPITITNAYVYLGTVISPEVTTPLIVTPEGYPIASITSTPDGRQNLTVTADNAPFLIHSMAISYGILNWLTNGLFIGERHVNTGYQVDDLFGDTDLWNPASPTIFENTGITYRLTGADITADLNWRNNVLYQQYPLANKLKLEWAFNGEGTTTKYKGLGPFNPDTLTPAIVNNQSQYNYVNHTYTHLNLDTEISSTIQNELIQNDQVAKAIKMTSYSKDSMVQPDISGLFNPEFFAAAKAFGIKYVIADTSRAGWNNPTPNAGFYSTIDPSILIIPRRATNLFYPISNPSEWEGLYNCFYSIPNGTCANRQFVYWDRDLTYSEILDKESDWLLSYLLKWDIDPVMFHTAQIRAYDGTRTVLNDLIERTMQKYHAISKLPIRNLTQHEIGIVIANRMAYNASGATATLTPCKNIVLKTVKAATIPVTGVSIATNGNGNGSSTSREVYNGQNISYVTLAANKSTTIALPACTTAAVAALSIDDQTPVDAAISTQAAPATEPDFAPPIEELFPTLEQ